MGKFRRLAAGVVVTCVLMLAGLAAATGTASAAAIGSCSKSGVLATCAVSGAPSNPLTISAAVTSSPDEAGISWIVSCTQGGSQQRISGSFTGRTPFTHTIPHPFGQPDQCGVVVTGGLSSGAGDIHLTVSWSSTPPSTAVKG